MTSERRRSPRISVRGTLSGRVAHAPGSVLVRDMSLGGLAMEASVPFDVGAVHEIELTLGDGATVLLHGRIAHCRRIDAAGGPPSYLIGVQFVDDQTPPDPSVRLILDDLDR